MLSICPHCNRKAVKEVKKIQKFQYGIRHVVLSVEVPVMCCLNCNEKWTDYRGEELREAEVLRYQSIIKSEKESAMLLTCPCCKQTYEIKYTLKEVEGATADCRECGATLIFKNGVALDFHKYLHAEIPEWPEDGAGTGYLTISSSLPEEDDTHAHPI